MAFAQKHPDIRLTFFVSGTCFLSGDRRTLYQGPGEEPGKARIRFGGTQSQLLERARLMDSFFRAGHEIASHGVGHFDGAAWTAQQWLTELQSYDRLVDDFRGNNGLDASEALAFGSADIRGVRGPFRSIGPGLTPALAARGYVYDARRAGRAGDWPARNADGVWKFKLASIPLRGSRRAPLSMDYNLFVAQTLDDPEIFSDPDRLEHNAVDTYLNYFKKNYFGNRAPIYISHYFTGYSGKVYEQAIMRFIETVARRPDVRFCTHTQMAAELDKRPAGEAEPLRRSVRRRPAAARGSVFP